MLETEERTTTIDHRIKVPPFIEVSEIIEEEKQKGVDVYIKKEDLTKEIVNKIIETVKRL